MKVLLLGKPYFKAALEALGHEVKCLDGANQGDVRVTGFPVGVKQILALLPKGWEPEFVLLGEESMHPMFLGLEFLDVPVGWLAMDSHIHLAWHRAYAAAFDFIWVVQRDYVDAYRWDGRRQTVQWSPVWADPTVDRDLGLPREHDLVFVGTLNPAWNPERVKLIQAVQARLPIHLVSGDYAEPFNRAKLVLNQCVANDINFRTMQAMGCGALLLMERIGNGLEELFEDRKHLVLYEKGNVDEVVALTRYYAAHEAERRAIAAAGREAVLAAHTTTHRVQAMLDLLASSDLHGIVTARKREMETIERLMALVYEQAAHDYAAAAVRHPDGSPMRLGRLQFSSSYQYMADTIRKELGLEPSAVPA